MTLFFVEKESTGVAILQHLKSKPVQFGSGPFFFVIALGESATKFTWPRLSWRDFPAIREPQHAQVVHSGLSTGNFPFYRARVFDDSWVDVSQDCVRDAAVNAGGLGVVCACELADTGAWAFAQAAQDLFGIQGFPITPDLRILSCSEAGLADAFAGLVGGVTTAPRASLYAGKMLQRRFEYNWWLNANALLRPALMAAGLDDARAPSKYEMQLLYSLRERPPMSVENCLSLMRSWSGTGKYLPLSLGSPKSRAPMIENLLRMRALVSSGPLFSLSEEGMRLLSALPKDCEDPDLPMRLAIWKSQPATSTVKVDAYLFKWFSKIKRSLDLPRLTQNA